MKSILISVKPKYVANILNDLQSILITKNEPNCDLPIDVYIYCTKEENLTFVDYRPFGGCAYENTKLGVEGTNLSGKVVAKFTLNKVEKIKYQEEETEDSVLFNKLTCLSNDELDKYLKCNTGYAWHISNLVIFDKPKELSEFRKPDTLSLKQLQEFGLPYNEKNYKEMATKGKWFITKAPRSWCYVEVE